VKSDTPAVSVAICTYNRAASLAGTLETAAGLRVPTGLAWELLIVEIGRAHV
jgi:glycosyltransferase involved in cell wall biosynthesis